MQSEKICKSQSVQQPNPKWYGSRPSRPGPCPLGSMAGRSPETVVKTVRERSIPRTRPRAAAGGGHLIQRSPRGWGRRPVIQRGDMRRRRSDGGTRTVERTLSSSSAFLSHQISLTTCQPAVFFSHSKSIPAAASRTRRPDRTLARREPDGLLRANYFKFASTEASRMWHELSQD